MWRSSFLRFKIIIFYFLPNDSFHQIPSPATMPPKTIAFEEVKKHNKEKDLWMVIDGKVYDVTKFVDEHPGGVDTLLDVAGADGTAEFDGVGHSDSAKEQLKKFLIGELSAEDRALAKSSKKGPQGTQGSNLAIAFVIALLAVVLFLVLRE